MHFSAMHLRIVVAADTQTKSAEPELRAVGVVAGLGELGDDLGSLHQGGHRDRREQRNGESKSSGFEERNLGHLISLECLMSRCL